MGTGPILPNLMHFSASLSHFTEMPLYPALVIGPYLETLYISSPLYSYPEEPIDDKLLAANLTSVLAPISSSISSYSLILPSGRVGGILTSLALTRLYCGFTSMKYFNLQETHVSSKILVALSALPHLKSLKIIIIGTELAKFNSIVKANVIFSSLNELWVKTDALVQVQRFLEHPRVRALQSFQITDSFNHANAWEVDSFMDTFRGRRGYSRLSHFGIFKRESWSPSTLHPNITNRTLIPLLSYANMKTLTINIGVVMIDNIILKEMSQAWPNLELLNFSDRTTDTLPQATFSGLLPLIACCRNLQTLVIRVNVLSDGLPTRLQMKGLVPGTALQSLDICTSPVEYDVDTVAGMISYIFPRLKTFHRGWVYYEVGGSVSRNEPTGVEGEYYQCWGKIMRKVIRRHLVTSWRFLISRTHRIEHLLKEGHQKYCKHVKYKPELLP